MSYGQPGCMERVLLLDNYDSFTWNVADGLAAVGAEVDVRRVDAIDLEGIEAAAPDLLVISPGPGRPEDAHLSLSAIRKFAGRIPILGICLGHQCIALAFGGTVTRSSAPVHGKTSTIRHDGRGLFTGLDKELVAGRYHSLVVGDVPAVLEVTAWSDDKLIMALRHRSLAIAGLQFHPDSFLTPTGASLFRNAIDARF